MRWFSCWRCGHRLLADAYEEAELGQPGWRQRVQLRNGYTRSMSELPSRELRNDTAGVLRRVEAGEVLTITVKGKPVAQLAALAPSRRRWLSRAELSRRLQKAQADPGLRGDLAALFGDTTDDLGPIQ